MPQIVSHYGARMAGEGELTPLAHSALTSGMPVEAFHPIADQIMRSFRSE